MRAAAAAHRRRASGRRGQDRLRVQPRQEPRAGQLGGRGARRVQRRGRRRRGRPAAAAAVVTGAVVRRLRVRGRPMVRGRSLRGRRALQQEQVIVHGAGGRAEAAAQLRLRLRLQQAAHAQADALAAAAKAQALRRARGPRSAPPRVRSAFLQMGTAEEKRWNSTSSPTWIDACFQT